MLFISRGGAAFLVTAVFRWLIFSTDTHTDAAGSCCSHNIAPGLVNVVPPNGLLLLSTFLLQF